MRKTTPGTDRIKATELRATVAAAKVAMDKHVPLCFRCKNAGTDLEARCTTWWRIARNWHETRRTLRQYETPSIEGELTLFDVGDL